jgi:hypothetical protein
VIRLVVVVLALACLASCTSKPIVKGAGLEFEGVVVDTLK